MALATTTLSTAATATDNSIVVASATSLVAGRIIRIDDEWLKVIGSYVSGTTAGVLRGQNGSVAVAHVVTANVVHGDAADFSLPPSATGEAVTTPAQRARRIVSQTATGTMTLPKAGEDLHLILNGTSVIAVTIPVPTKDLDGCLLIISGNGAAAHTYTFTGGLSGAGASYDVITINATAPTSGMYVAVNGLWQPFFGPAMGGTVTNLIGSIA